MEQDESESDDKRYLIHRRDYLAFRMIESGIGEQILEVLLHLSDERAILRSALLLLCKLVYKGKYFSCVRLVSLGICAKVWNQFKPCVLFYFDLIIITIAFSFLLMSIIILLLQAEAVNYNLSSSLTFKKWLIS